jgi:hypothetical protein
MIANQILVEAGDVHITREPLNHLTGILDTPALQLPWTVAPFTVSRTLAVASAERARGVATMAALGVSLALAQPFGRLPDTLYHGGLIPPEASGDANGGERSPRADKLGVIGFEPSTAPFPVGRLHNVI